MRQYLDLMKNILENGEERSDRTGTGTKSIFGTQLRFDLRKGFPAMTTKRLFFKGIVHELLWFLNGDTNVKYLKDNGVGIWDEWADENGDLGPVYGKQWRKWEYMKHTPTKEIWDDYYVKTQIDQVANIIEQIKTNPYSRRLLVSAWNPTVLPDVNLKPHENPALGLQALPPCHYSWQCYVNNGRLSLLFNMRSIDTFLGLSFNIASYALLCHMIAHVCRLEVGDLIFSGGDTHLYLNHIEQAKLQLTREPYDLPTLKIKRKVENIDDFKYEDFELENYKAHPHIKADIAI